MLLLYKILSIFSFVVFINAAVAQTIQIGSHFFEDGDQVYIKTDNSVFWRGYSNVDGYVSVAATLAAVPDPNNSIFILDIVDEQQGTFSLKNKAYNKYMSRWCCTSAIGRSGTQTSIWTLQYESYTSEMAPYATFKAINNGNTAQIQVTDGTTLGRYCCLDNATGLNLIMSKGSEFKGRTEFIKVTGDAKYHLFKNDDKKLSKLSKLSSSNDIPNLIGLKFNDNIQKIEVDEGYVLAAYEKINYGGAARLYVGSMPVEYALKNKISSIRIRRYSESDCAYATEHAHRGGTAWIFCLIENGHVGMDQSHWKEKISSVVVPEGLRLSFCSKDDEDKLCRSYTKSQGYVGAASNDRFVAAALSRFDDSDFSMIFMSDPQFGWDSEKPMELAVYRDDYKNTKVKDSWKISAIYQSISMSFSRTNLWRRNLSGVRVNNYAGMVVNGDITNTGSLRQLREFNHIFAGLHGNIYPGLGNHDYDNYVLSSGSGYRDVFKWMDDYVINSPGLISYDMNGGIQGDRTRKFYLGSFAYSWDIGDVHFIQLNNYPSYALLNRDDNPQFYITKSLDWLTKDIRDNGQGKRIIINMHNFGSAGFSSAGCISPCGNSSSRSDRQSLSERERSSNTIADYTDFMSSLILAQNVAKDHVVLVFSGHIHQYAGSNFNYKSQKRWQGPANTVSQIGQQGGNGVDIDAGIALRQPSVKIPKFYTGGAEYSKHLLVRFKPDSIVIKTIDSRTGSNTTVQTATVTNADPETVTVTTP